MALGGRDVLKLIVDADSSGASREFDRLGSGIKRSLGDAETQAKGLSGVLGRAFDGLAAKSPMVSGIFDKLGVSGTQAGAAIATAIPFAAVAAGGAIAAFAAKGVGDFQKVALAAGKFSDASGLSVEQASRWIAVADDIGVGSTTVQSAFIKMEKAIGSNRAAFGDMIATAKDGSVDLSATFLNVTKHLQGIEDPIQRATESSKLFGKGFAEVSQLIGMNADDLRKRLEGVSDAQVISESELGKAREFQEATDRLGDSVRDLGMQIGSSLVPALAGAANSIGAVVEGFERLGSVGGGVIGQVFGQLNAINPLHIMQGVGGVFQEGASGIDRFGSAIGIAIPKLGEFIKGMDNVKAGFAIPGLDIVSGQLQAGAVDAGGWGASVAAAGGVARQSIEQVSAAFALMQGNLSAEEAILGLQDSFARVGDTAIEAFSKVSSGEAGAEQAVRNNSKAVIDLKQQVVAYGDQILGLPPQRVTELLAMIDSGNLAGAEAELNKAAEERKAKMTAVPSSQAAVADFDAAVRARRAEMLGVANTGAAEGALTNTARSRQASIVAAANAGAAEGSLNNTARSRAASINASANTGNAESVLNNLARPRTAVISTTIRQVGSFAVPAFAGGVRNYGGGLAMVGEGGPELVTLPKGADVYSAAETSAMMSGGPGGFPMSAGGSASRNTYVTIQTGVGDPVAIGRAVKQVIAAAERAGVN